MAIFTDEEHRILLSAMSKETDLCKKFDAEVPGVVNLEDVCKSINRKISIAQRGGYAELSKVQRKFLVYCIMTAARESYPLFNFRSMNGEYECIYDLAIELAKLLGASVFDLECIERGI